MHYLADGVPFGQQFLLVEIPVVTGGFGSLVWWGLRRWFQVQDQRWEAATRQLTAQDHAMTTQSQALATVVERVAPLPRRIEIVEERITGLRESTAELRGVVLAARRAEQSGQRHAPLPPPRGAD